MSFCQIIPCSDETRPYPYYHCTLWMFPGWEINLPECNWDTACIDYTRSNCLICCDFKMSKRRGKCAKTDVLMITIRFHYNIWGCMCSTGPFQLRWLKGYTYSSCYYHNQIGSINLTHCCHIFPWLCAWDVCYILFCHLLHIHSGKSGILFSSLLCSLWWVQIVWCVLAYRSCSFIFI